MNLAKTKQLLLSNIKNIKCTKALALIHQQAARLKKVVVIAKLLQKAVSK